MARRRRSAGALIAACSAVAIVALVVGWAREQPPPAAGTMPSGPPHVEGQGKRPPPGPSAARIATHPARLDQLVMADRPEPVALTISAAGIDAPIVSVGVDAAGTAMAVPADPSVVAWYSNGPSPGEAGSAVLAGHVDYDERRGVFFDLEHLELGSEVVVAYDDGSSRRFTVVARDRYDKAALPTATLFRQQGDPTLTLITCGGAYERRTHTYRDNVVVVAV